MNYDISLGAEKDIDDITIYTLETWGMDAVKKYVGELKDKLELIGRGEVIKEESFDIIPNLYVTRFQFHLIYYFSDFGKKPQIVRILHHKQDKMRHLLSTYLKLN